MALGGLDIGTSGCKCTIMTAGGELLASCYQAYAVSRTASAHEVEGRVIWEAVRTVIAGACAKSREPMTALCVTSFGESCALLDDQGRELGPILLYTDPRGQEQCEAHGKALGGADLRHLRPSAQSHLFSAQADVVPAEPAGAV